MTAITSCRLRSRTRLIGGVGLMALALASPALAQEALATQAEVQQVVPEGETATDRVIVTGSRIQRDGFDAPTPVTVATTEQLEASAPTTLSDALLQLPVFRQSGRPQNVSVSSTGNNGGSYLNLRALGANRTLVMLDGRRLVPASGNGIPDTNALPQDLVRSVEIVTGGASAAYGSDAVAGVVNFILDTDFEGLRAEIQHGISTYGDAPSYKARLSGGTSFADGRGHFIASGEYYNSKAADDIAARDWAAADWGLIPNVPASASPRLVLARDVGNSHATFGGLITAGPLAGTQFLPGGSPAAFQYGDLRSSQFMVGGDGELDFSNLGANLERWSTFARASYDVSDTLEVFAEASLAHSNTFYRQRSAGNVAGNRLEIFSDNAFLPDATRAAMATAGVNSFLMSRTHRDFGPMQGDSTSETWRLMAGVDADLTPDWSLNAYVSTGENNFLTYTRGNMNYRNMYAATDAVRDPVSGQIVCRSTLAGLDPGCVPINLFGEGSPSAAAIKYVTGSSFYDMTIKQDVAAFSIQGAPFSTWAGPVDVAFGGEYRKESAVQAVDDLSTVTLSAAGLRGMPTSFDGANGGWSHTNPKPIEGGYEIREAFVEFVAPLAQDLPFANSLELNGGLRYADYSTSGGVTAWKLGVSYEPVDMLRLRATRSRDIRAANIVELYTGSRQSSGIVREPGTGNTRNFVGSTQGNPILDPEIAETYTVGFVFQPSFDDFTLRASVDFFDMSIDGAVASFSAQQTLDRCAAGSQIACAQIQEVGGTYRITLPFLNLDSIETRGVDFEASYSRDFMGGQLGVRGLLTYMDRLIESDSSGVSDDLAGDVGTQGLPKWAGNLNVSYKRGPFGVFLQERYIGGGKYNRTFVEGVDVADNTLDPIFYTDLTVRYDVLPDSRVEVYATVNNLFNQDPHIAPQQSSERFRASNFGIYDSMGRYVTVGAKARF